MPVQPAPGEEGKACSPGDAAPPYGHLEESSGQHLSCSASGEESQGVGESSSPRRLGRGGASQQGVESGGSESRPDGVSVPASARGFRNEGETRIGFHNLQPLGSHSDIASGGWTPSERSPVRLIYREGRSW